MQTQKLIDALSNFELFTVKSQKKQDGRDIVIFESEGGTCLLEVAGKRGEIKTVTLSMGFLQAGEAGERNAQTLGISMGMIKAFFPEWKEGPACILADCGELSERNQKSPHATGGGRRIAYQVGIYSISVMDMAGKRLNLVIRK